MNETGGAVLILGGAAGALATVLVLWPRLPRVAGLALLAACGAVVASGGLLVQDRAGAGDWAITIAVLAFLTPLQGRLVFGPSGSRRVAAGLLPRAPRPRTKGGNP